MDFKKLFTGLKIAQTIVENDGKPNENTIFSAVFDRRMSTSTSFFDTYPSLIMCSHRDFPALRQYETLSFQGYKNELKGYLYHPQGNCSKGLILYVHGIGGSAFDWYAIGINEWVKRGYTVFAIELSASGSSGGYGIDGLHQSALDVASAVKFVQMHRVLGRFPLFLFGHSWGGYGVSASLALLQKKPCAVAELSGFATPLLEMLGLPEAKLSGMNLGNTEELERALYNRGGQFANLSAVDAIRDSHVGVFCAHGDKDETVPYKQASILYRAYNLSNVASCLCHGKDHVNIFFNEEACQHRARDLAIIQSYMKEYGKSLSKLPPEIRREIESKVDRFKNSQIDESLFEDIDRFFVRHTH